MNNKKIAFSRFFICCCIWSIPCSILSQNNQSPGLRNQAITLTRFLQKNHFQPREINDRFSADVFDYFIDLLDEKKQFFRAEDINILSAYRDLLDDELSGAAKWEFMGKLMPIYAKRLLQADSILQSIYKKPFVYSDKETVITGSPKIRKFAVTAKEWEDRWQKIIKYNVLLSSSISLNKSNDNVKYTSFREAETRAKEITKAFKEKEIRRITEFEGGAEGFAGLMLLNSIAACFDPHTNFFQPIAKEEFENEVSGFEYSVGIEINENSAGEKAIAYIIPGGSAWKSGEIHEGDILEKISISEREQDISLKDEDEVSAMLVGEKEELVEVTVRNSAGITKTVSLQKEKIKNDENFVKGYVLKGEKNVGYINLPGFYSSNENETGSSCANDVAKEIVKLKNENIQGLILDIRSNGGGSMQEAMELAGIFINEGVLCAVKEKGTDKVHFIKDMNRGTIYNGPLIVIVNEQSASASEMVSSVLQDYNRALIVGSRTYGKGTMQRVFALDTISLATRKTSKNGFVKITIGKFYRVNGSTVQHLGVIPDIVFPGIYDYYPMHESDEKFALQSDSVKKGYYTPLPDIEKNTLSSQSKARQDKEPWANATRQFAKFIGDRENETVTLTEQGVNSFLSKMYLQQEEMEKSLDAKATVFMPAFSKFDLNRWQSMPERKEYNERLLENIQHDPELEEVYNIMKDYINLKK